LAAKPPPTWDNLVRVKSNRMNFVYLLPGADFRGYTKVMLDPTQISFEKNWQRDYNRTQRSPSSQISDADVEQAIADGGKDATEIFAQGFAAGGYTVVTQPGPDVLRVTTAITNLYVTAPDKMTAGRSRTYARSAGSATLVVEVADSVSGAIMGRAVDNRVVGDNTVRVRSSVTNRSDFRAMAQRWAKRGVEGLDELKRLSPIDTAGNPP
jgi:hypothetical protein